MKASRPRNFANNCRLSMFHEKSSNMSELSRSMLPETRMPNRKNANNLFVWASEKRFGVLLTNEPGFGLVVQLNYLGADVVRQMLVQGVTEMEL